MSSRTRIFTGIIGFGLIFLFACNGSEEGVSESAVPQSTDVVDVANGDIAADATPTEEAVPTATPKPTVAPTNTPTPIPAGISLSSSVPEMGSDSDPIFLEKAEIVFDQISIPEDGWLVIWPDLGGSLAVDKALGFIEIDKGVSDDIAVAVDIAEIKGRSVQVALHGGRLSDGDFEAETDNLLLIQTLAVDTPASRPMIETAATVVSEDGFLQVDQVQSDGPGWLVIFDESGDDMLGFAPVKSGKSAVSVPIQWHIATTNLHIHLLQDLGNVGEFEFDIDTPAVFQGESVILDLAVGLPAEIIAFDQPMLDSVVVSRITSPQDGFVVIFGDPDSNGFPDTILGSAPIKAGASELVVIDINDAAVTDQTVISLFVDSNGSGVFDFPEDDPILIGMDEPVQFFTPLRSDVEAFLVVDSYPTMDAVHVSYVGTVIDSWLVVERIPAEVDESAESDPAEPEPPVGQLRLAPGLQYDIDIPLEGVEIGDKIKVMLYINNPDMELFEPERNDFPLVANSRFVFVELIIQ
ncbi:MAG: hypothetical protein ACI9EW_000137 [Cellvibrionaceae bacterium]|jgi:hypothetical protein